MDFFFIVRLTAVFRFRQKSVKSTWRFISEAFTHAPVVVLMCVHFQSKDFPDWCLDARREL